MEVRGEGVAVANRGLEVAPSAAEVAQPAPVALRRPFGLPDPLEETNLFFPIQPPVDASQGDAVEKNREITGGGAHYTFEAIGNKDVAEQAFDALRSGGTATIIGMIPIGQKVELNGASFLQEKKIQGCTMGSNRFRIDMPRYVEYYLNGILKLDEMITVRGKLEDVNEAFRAMKAGEVARTVLMFE